MRPKTILLTRLLLIFSLVALIGDYQLNAQQYDITDLGVLSGTTYSTGLGVNSSGAVVGCSGAPQASCPSVPPAGFLWEQQTGLRVLTPLAGYNLSAPAAINDAGVIAGYSQHTANGIGPSRAVIWTNGVPQDLGSLFPHCGAICDMYGSAISQNGFVTGCGDMPDGNPIAFFWNQQRGMLGLGTLDFYGSCGTGVNSNGAVVGYVYDIGLATAGFFWTQASGMLLIRPLTGTNYWSPASAINDKNEVVGNTTYSVGSTTYSHAYLWTKNQGLTDLGALGSRTEVSAALAINDNSQIVGFSGFPANAFIWSKQQGMVDLNTLIDSNSGWVLNTATSISNNGLITGSGTINAETHAFLLTPNLP